MKLEFRHAELKDLPEIVRMLADDFLGGTREKFEDPLPASYLKAFHEIDADQNNELVVAVLSEPPAIAGGLTAAEDKDVRVPTVVGTMQLTFTPSISFQGGKRATVESVRVDGKFRGLGIGWKMMLWAIERAREENCISMQLTTNSDRKDAHRFYENLGFIPSHLGMKLKLK